MSENDGGIFLSYASVDRIYAERLATDLRAWGVRVWWDQWEIRVGDSLTEKLQQGLTASSKLAVILTPESVASSWVQREIGSALMRELDERRVTVLPLLFRDCEVPALLRDKKHADFRESYHAGFEALLNALSPPVEPEVVQRLLSGDRGRVLSAMAAVPERARELHHEHLLGRLSSGEPGERAAVTFALWALDSRYLPLALLAGMRDPVPSVRRRAVHLAGETMDPAYRRAVSGLLSDGNPQVRAAARDAENKLRRGRS